MRVQTAHQTVLQKGMPTEILIGLSVEETKHLAEALDYYVGVAMASNNKIDFAEDLLRRLHLLKVI